MEESEAGVCVVLDQVSLLCPPVRYKGSGSPCWSVGVGSEYPVPSGKVQGQRRELFWTSGETNSGELPRREVPTHSVTAVFGFIVRWLGDMGLSVCLTT